MPCPLLQNGDHNDVPLSQPGMYPNNKRISHLGFESQGHGMQSLKLQKVMNSYPAFVKRAANKNSPPHILVMVLHFSNSMVLLLLLEMK